MEKPLRQDLMRPTTPTKRKKTILALVGIGLLLLATACVTSPFPSSTLSDEYVVFAWNDLGMHCLNPSYDTAVILPPYNTVWAQVVKRGTPPQVVTDGLTVEYRMVGNTTSANKKSYGQFWTNAEKLFGASGLATDTGLNLEDPDVHNGLKGTMLSKDDHFQVNGIPLVPVGDDGVWNPYQRIEVTVRDSTGTAIATTIATVPTSDEINCAKCHGSGTVDSAFTDILAKHDKKNDTTPGSATTPVLCASCHGSPALGTSGPGSSGLYLSQAIHGFHASKGAACYDCHPGAVTKCTRSLAHTADDGNCTSCHGTLSNVAATVATGGRIPWANEPACAACHKSSSEKTLTSVSTIPVTAIADVDTGAELYRNSSGHGGMYCAACHGSPHAMVPSREASDQYQEVQYQGKAVTMGSCAACHAGSYGGGLRSFFKKHGGSKGETSACRVCHTGFSASASAVQAPHQFQWRKR